MPVVKPSLPLWLNVFITIFLTLDEKEYIMGFMLWGIVPSLLAAVLKQTLQSGNWPCRVSGKPRHMCLAFSIWKDRIASEFMSIYMYICIYVIHVCI